MDAAFLQIFCPATHVVLGRELRAPCLYDLLALAIAENPVGLLLSAEDKPASATCISGADLLQAVEILSRPIGEALKPGFYKPVEEERVMELATRSYDEEFAAFDAYAAATVSIPPTWAREEDGAEMGSPWMFAIALKIESKLPTRTEEQIWSMPLGKLLWTALTLAEIDGSAEIIPAEEAEAIRQIEEMKRKEAANGR